MSAEHYIANAHPTYIENLYNQFQNGGKELLDDGWIRFFEGFEFALKNSEDGNISVDQVSNFGKELKVFNLIYTYRKNAHLIAQTNPIRKRLDRNAGLDLSNFNLSNEDLETEFAVGEHLGIGKASLKNIVAKLNEIYCGPFGVEYLYVKNLEARHWLREKFENRPKDYGFDNTIRKRILKKLNETTVFEQFLGTKYLGEKRFSIEGGENAITALDSTINSGARLGVEEFVIGMAHRGRLNVLCNIMGKTYAQIFSEFEGNAPKHHNMGDGDVKYHLGFSSQYDTLSGNSVHMKLAPNPSHLEAVDPVVQGLARAQSDLLYGGERSKICPILIHGDAAVAGQGIVYEVAQMSKLAGYHIGGTIHLVINNQIGFTTDFHDARSSDYCTSVASVVEAPVIHVNGDDAEAVAYAAGVAMEYRQKFNSDVYIDMVCYRKHGHNEADDPSFTQPEMYKVIKKHKNPRETYINKLVEEKIIDKARAKEMEDEFKAELQARLDEVRQKPLEYKMQEPEIAWKKLRKSKPSDFDKSPSTKITKSTIATVVKGLIKVPEGFSPLRKVDKMLENRRQMMRDEKTVDWAAAELIAYGSILLDGNNIRMTGQDVKRGTFSHRHAILFDESTGEQYNRLNFLAENGEQGNFEIHNSLLSEFGVLGFEYGYSLASPDQLVLWEAQFGDFANGAQTMFDQFISSAESKWNRQSGLIMLLPHGYEGQGPEHSSARLERYLQACAEYNVSIANITTPANFFHAIRRQLKRPFRKPLVVMSPKSLLRHKRCISNVDELSKGGFQEVIDDANTVAATKVKRVLFCSGKIYYDLLEKKEADNRKDVAIVRLEQLYPLPAKQLDNVVEKYKNAELCWVQEEPSNMGAWAYVLSRYHQVGLKRISRGPSASPATGFKKIHLQEQKELVDQAFA